MTRVASQRVVSKRKRRKNRKNKENIDPPISNTIPTELTHTEKIMPDQPPENEEGNREYKWKLIPHEHDWSTRRTKLATQLNYRLAEGCGKCLYLLGVKDKGEASGIDLQSLYTTLFGIIDAATLIKKTTIDKIRIYKGTAAESDTYVATVRMSNTRLIEVF